MFPRLEIITTTPNIATTLVEIGFSTNIAILGNVLDKEFPHFYPVEFIRELPVEHQ